MVGSWKGGVFRHHVAKQIKANGYVEARPRILRALVSYFDYDRWAPENQL